MKGSKFLSELIDLNDIKTGTLNLIITQCGSGKTYFATNTLPTLVSKPHKMIYLIDTIIGKQQILKQSNMKLYNESWRKAVCSEYTDYKKDGIVVMTYHQFGHLIEEYNGFAKCFELIICDEIHNSVYFGNIVNDSNDINYARLAREEIINLVQRNTDIMIVGISATPEILTKYYCNCPVNLIIPIDVKKYQPIKYSDEPERELRRYETRLKDTFQNIYNLIPQLDNEKVGIIYTTHVKMMKNIVDFANINGFKAIAIWSKKSKHYMNDEQQAAWQYIVEKEELPSKYNLIVINASCGTAINIRSKVDYMVINHTSDTFITQVRGRVRDDLDFLLIKDKNTKDWFDIIIPPEYIGVPLYYDEKNLLCKMFPIRNKSGELTKWTTLKKYITESGYSITTHQDKKRKSFDIISE